MYKVNLLAIVAGAPALAQASQRGTIQTLLDDCQQALHLFFQQYSTQFADELANTCVLIICNATADATLEWKSTEGVLQPQNSSRTAVQNAATVHLQCKFFMKILQQCDFPMQAIYDAVCANIDDSTLLPGWVRQWLQST